jgi:hypothetical protein
VKDVDVLGALKEDEYRLGDLAAIRYDRKNTDLFPDDYLGHLYHRCRESKRRSGDGILTQLFGGNPASDFNSIVTYLASRSYLIILGRWEGEKFHELGFAFSVISCGFPHTEKSLFGGYGFFRDAWGTADQETVTMLGLAYLFKELDIIALHGIRYEDNLLTARFMAKFGFKVDGAIPYYQLKGNKLATGIISTLLRADFEDYVADFLVKQYREEEVEEPLILPLLTDTPREAIDAQVQRLAAGEQAVVYFPYSATYVPGIPPGMELKVVPQGADGAGIYFFNPRLIDESMVGRLEVRWSEVEKVVPLQEPHFAPPVIDVQWPEVEEVTPEPERRVGPTLVAAPPVVEELVTVQAFDEAGTLLRDKIVERTAEEVAFQIEAFKQRFPGCRCEVVAFTDDGGQPELPF